MDRLGPYTVPQLQRISDAWGPTASKGTRVVSAQGLAARLAAGDLSGDDPLVLLWRDTPTFGHFILLHWRSVRGKPVLELFDPLGVQVGGGSWESYMTDPQALNGSGLDSVFAGVMDNGYEVTYTPLSAAPQAPETFSCGLWCLLRAANPGPSPTDFRRGARSRT